MVVDSSALVAIVLLEVTAIGHISKLSNASSLSISTVSLVETSTVLLSRGGQTKVDILDVLLAEYGFEIVPVDLAQAHLARQAYERYGKGRDKAGLNLGDCFSYALAKYYGEPLLFQGNDFGRTDVAVA